MKLNLNLIKSLSMIFHKKTGIDLEELFSEACVAYCEALQSFNPKKKCKESTWAYRLIQHRLINFCKYEQKNKYFPEVDWYDLPTTPEYEFFNKEQELKLSEDVQLIIDMVQQNPDRYLVHPARKAVGRISHDLRDKQWTFPRVWEGMRNLRKELNGI